MIDSSTTLEYELAAHMYRADEMKMIAEADSDRSQDLFLRELFSSLDKHRKGTLSKDDFTQGLHQLQLPTPKSKIEKLFNRLDTNQDGTIQYSEFVEFVSKRDRALRKTFDQMDSDKDGFLGRHDLRKAANKVFGIRLSENALDHLLHRADLDSSGTVSFDEFRRLLVLAPSISSRDLFEFWREMTDLDAGEFQVPEVKDGTHVQPWKTLIAGACAGAVSRTATAPLDRLKVLLQAEVPGQKRQFDSLFGTARYIYEQGGFKAFFRGNGTNVLKVAPETACKFFFFDAVKQKVCADPNNTTVGEKLVAGSIAGMISQALIYPLEGLYRGLLPSLIGIAPYAGVDLAVYNMLKDLYVSQHSADADPGVFTLLLCGATSSTCGMLVSYPLQLVRTRLQAQGAQLGSASAPTPKDSVENILKTGGGGRRAQQPVLYNGLVDCFVRTVKADGWKGLYRGIIPNFMKTLPAVSISYATFDSVKNYLRKLDPPPPHG